MGVGRHALCSLVVLAACAGGAEDGSTGLPMIHNTDSADAASDDGGNSLTTGISESATGGASQGTSEGDGSTTGSTSAAVGETSAGSTTTGGPEGTSTTTGGTTGSGEGSSTTMGGDETTGGPATCPNDVTCPTATILGEVSGDEASPNLVTQGTTPTWVAFQVTEDNDSVSGENLQFSATLQSPAGYDFDLYVYRGAAGASNGCNGTLQQSTAAEGIDVVSMSWGEGGIANGSDDRRWIAVEVASKDGTCDPGAEWVLTIEGD